jgi:lysophospholipase L1-like esterase
MLRSRLVLARTTLVAFLPFLACAGASPRAIERHPVAVVVFYDEDGDGVLDGDEVVRLPGVRVAIEERSATTGARGRAEVPDVPAGRHAVTVDAGSLPPFYVAGHAVTAVVPTREVLVPATLPIGPNRPNAYMAFGDSITSGVGYADGQSYRARLESMLASHFGAATVIDQGSSHSRSNQGAQRIAASLAAARPAYTLVLYGTNDWNFPACKQVEGCFTVRSLRRILRAVKEARSLPCLATLPPSNLGFDHRTPPERNEWVAGINEDIRALAREEGALLVDLHAAFPPPPELRGFFTDHVHPNGAGFERIAGAFFEALTRRRAGPARP